MLCALGATGQAVVVVIGVICGIYCAVDSLCLRCRIVFGIVYPARTGGAARSGLVHLRKAKVKASGEAGGLSKP